MRREAEGMRREMLLVLLFAPAALLSGCGTTHATIPTSRGERLMLLGHDPVAYFSEKKPVRGTHTIAAAYEGRTYYDTGGILDNLVFKYPGWRAREGFGQPRLGVPGESDDIVPVAR